MYEGGLVGPVWRAVMMRMRRPEGRLGCCWQEIWWTLVKWVLVRYRIGGSGRDWWLGCIWVWRDR